MLPVAAEMTTEPVVAADASPWVPAALLMEAMAASDVPHTTTVLRFCVVASE
jgi:hypothetical protein